MKQKTLQDISKHAAEVYPQECCGLVLAVGRKEKYIPCVNRTTRGGGDHFVISVEDWEAAEAIGEIIMIVHSHPDASHLPSEADRVGCEAHGLPWCIVAVHGDPAKPNRPPVVTGHSITTPSGFELPMRGREYRFGVSDCYSIVQDYYRQELGIELPKFHRQDGFWLRGENLIMEHLSENGFTPIPAPTQKGDLILMSLKSDVVNHFGIWLDERGAMLHHPYGHLSEATVFGGYWLENTRLYVRKTS